MMPTFNTCWEVPYFRADDYEHAEEPLQRALTLCPGYTGAEEGLPTSISSPIGMRTV